MPNGDYPSDDNPSLYDVAKAGGLTDPLLEVPESIFSLLGYTGSAGMIGVVGDPFTQAVLLIAKREYHVTGNAHTFIALQDRVLGDSANANRNLGFVIDRATGLVFGGTYEGIHNFFGLSVAQHDDVPPDLSMLTDRKYMFGRWVPNTDAKQAAVEALSDIETLHDERRESVSVVTK